MVADALTSTSVAPGDPDVTGRVRPERAQDRAYRQPAPRVADGGVHWRDGGGEHQDDHPGGRVCLSRPGVCVFRVW